MQPSETDHLYAQLPNSFLAIVLSLNLMRTGRGPWTIECTNQLHIQKTGQRMGMICSTISYKPFSVRYDIRVATLAGFEPAFPVKGSEAINALPYFAQAFRCIRKLCPL